jgi:cation transport ATPase
LNPAVAAVLHNVSTIAVVLNSGRLVRYRPPSLASLNGKNGSSAG